MFTYTIIEAQNLNSIREGVTQEFKDLAAAKRFATRNQTFQGTSLKIVAKNGETVATKDCGAKKWSTFE